MSHSNCCVGRCVNRKSNEVSLHTFPKNMAQRRLWIRGIQTTRAEWNGPKMATTQVGSLLYAFLVRRILFVIKNEVVAGFAV
ncbi:hypothetical protein DPMN_029331 [Dreissena polymorpha]|uniref:THAP-type domain-containing protein n=1 Tax=Dreissena polymorpha TaxID=45954 RepID=A0A9D4LYD7_DREPO|nr:hypothetical protein DPMN_029331 [Dreissena polymorpha]